MPVIPARPGRAFQGFAGQFNDVNEVTLSLSRPSSVRGLADKLIEASQEEAAALRRLRDGWQPGDTLLLEAVASKRVASAAAQKKVEDKLVDLQEGTDADSLEELTEFSTAFDALQSDWEEFHDSYESLKGEPAGSDPAANLSRIEELIGDFDDLMSDVDDLPSAEQAEDLAEALAAAAGSQKKGLQELKSELERLMDVLPSPAPYDAFDGYVKESKGALKDARKELKNLTEDGPAKDTAAVQDL